MNMTNGDFEAIKKALELLPKGNRLVWMDEETQNIVKNAELVMMNLSKKKEANNKRIAEYIADKRKYNRNYAR